MPHLLLEIRVTDFADLVSILGRSGYGVYVLRGAQAGERTYKVRPVSDGKRARRRRVSLFDAASYAACAWDGVVDPEIITPTG